MIEREDALQLRFRGGTLLVEGRPTVRERGVCAAALFLLLRRGWKHPVVDVSRVHPLRPIVSELAHAAYEAFCRHRHITLRAEAREARVLHVMGVDRYCSLEVAGAA